MFIVKVLRDKTVHLLIPSMLLLWTEEYEGLEEFITEDYTSH